MSRWHTTIAAALATALALPAVAQDLDVYAGENGTGYTWGSPYDGDSRGAASNLRTAARAGESFTLTGRAYAVSVPPRHVVRSGDTLWGICDSRLQNPWLWPEVWALNPEITNPHWIYPGQVIRLRTGEAAAYGYGSRDLPRGYDDGTVYFRSEGFVEAPPEEERGEDDEDEDRYDRPPGTITASWEDEMMLAYPDVLYVRFREDFPVEAGQQYTVYRPRETIHDFEEDDEGEPVELGRIVEILGTATVLTFDPDARLARMRVVEAINPIERGDAVGPIERNFVVSRHTAADVDLDGRIVATLRPRVLNGEAFLVFVNRGYEAGVRDGNRFQIIRANDHFLASNRQDVPPDLPFEWIGECQVLEARRLASTCLILESTREMEIGERVTLIRGR